VPSASRATMVPDIQGSIIGTLDSGTAALSKTGYQRYGENPANLTGPYRYTGRRFDPEPGGSTAQPSGLYHYRARSYSPTLGRFLQPDPIGYAAGNNLYAYVGNDPLNLVDPTGLDALVIVGGVWSDSLNIFGQCVDRGHWRRYIQFWNRYVPRLFGIRICEFAVRCVVTNIIYD
jgi:RHS repeat-associated protein